MMTLLHERIEDGRLAARIRTLGVDDAYDVESFRILAAESGLPGLADLDEVLCSPGFAMLLAETPTGLMGCAGLRLNAEHQYVSGDSTHTFAQPNVMLFGAYVRPQARGIGIGGLLYRRRLALAEQMHTVTTIVELLGDGTPGSVHADTRPGLGFHLAAGFIRIGHSPDPDGGLVLARTEVHA
jgi:hypothetical protein